MNLAWQEFLAGAAAMYILDPSTGARRRALFRFVITWAWRWTAGQSSRHLGRVPGVGGRWVRGREPSDAELLERVQSRLEEMPQPSAIEVRIKARKVTLSGPILARDVVGLLRYVAQVPGVIVVNNRLRVRRLPPPAVARRLNFRNSHSGTRRDVS